MVYVQGILDYKMKICVVIPTYNEAKTITALINQIRLQGFEIVVVDDGSKDNTAIIAADSGATVLRNPDNEGKGVSLVKGFNYALDKDFDAVVTMDGDGQHLPQDIPFFIKAAECSDSAVFVGNRMSHPENMPFLRILTNKLMSYVISKVARQRIYDTQCGFRLIKKGALKKIDLATRKYEIESEMLIKASRLGFRIESIPIRTVYGGQKSQINPILDTVRFIKFFLRELSVRNIKQKNP